MDTKMYPQAEETVDTVSEPIAAYEITMAFKREFENAWAHSISSEEFSRRMDKRIEQWQWKK
ncbi:MAG: hypothetical protein LBN27_06085 [Prevotellaceae bacterium]|jgi:hypothetical protein|nr:hypothetical protein [Prevotellaceae bacterium]